MNRIHTLKEMWQCDGLQRLLMVATRIDHCLGDYLGGWAVRKVSDKERLEEVVENVVFLRGLTGALNAELPEDDFWYLYEQAERVQELEKRIKELEYASKYNGKLNEFLQKRKLPPNTLGRHVVEVVMDYVEELEQQNKRYREYLELIRITATHGKDIKTGEIIRSDEANLADEALEGEG